MYLGDNIYMTYTFKDSPLPEYNFQNIDLLVNINYFYINNIFKLIYCIS